MFDIIQACPRCSVVKKKATDNLSDGICADCSIRTVAIRRYADANVPVEYWDLSMDNFHGPGKLKSKYEEIVGNLPEVYKKGYTICLAGQHGVGKTMSLCNIIKVASLKGYTGLYTSLSDIANVSTSPDMDDRFSAQRELKSVDFLTIDEVDDRFLSQSNHSNEFFSRLFELTLRTRIQNSLPTFIATNSPNLREVFGGAFKASLGSLLHKFVTITVVGEDVRRKVK